MPQLLPECPAAWKLITLGVLPKYLLSGLGGAGWGRQGYFSPTSFRSLVTVLNHILSRCKTTGPKDRDEDSCCPGQLYYLNPLHKLIPLSLNEVKKGAVPRGQETPIDSSWVERLGDCQVLSSIHSMMSWEKWFLSFREGSQSSSAKWSPPENYKKWVALAKQFFVLQTSLLDPPVPLWKPAKMDLAVWVFACSVRLRMELLFCCLSC